MTQSDYSSKLNESFEEAPLWAAIVTYFGYLILNIFGWFRDLIRYFGIEEKKGALEYNPKVRESILTLRVSHLIEINFFVLKGFRSIVFRI